MHLQSIPPWLRLIACALLITLAQIALIFAAEHRSTWTGEYLHLIQWDARHYLDIAQDGYYARLPDPLPVSPDEARMLARETNVTFFPGYPLAIRWFSAVTRIPITWASIITAQLFAIGFWTYLFLLLRRWKVGPLPTVAVVIALFAYPSAFYLVAPYSESLFLCSMLGFLYWYSVPGWPAKIIAGLHGVVMSATRIFGLILAVFPLLHELIVLRPTKRNRLMAGALVTAVSAAGALLFFLYCQIAFGHWNLYMLGQLWGWSIAPDYLSPFVSIPRLLFPTLTHIGREPHYEGRLASSLLMWLLLLWPLIECIRYRLMCDDTWRERAALYILAWINFYLLLSTLIGVGFSSMIRYTFVVFMFFLLIVAHFLQSLPAPRSSVRWGAMIALCIVAGLSLMLQMEFVAKFTSGGWVA